ncbi:hypothetical protein [Thermincola potens]|uniref:Flagellar protein n=1 Tax=Thermincola potens (strain JR) TaxID=635013 RepID=D5XBI9_THEPJ|nr:hypothetical protein [Thermincola potens]ADG83418.1 conserved hypothetical protein [Thermincola potens JR]
MALVNCRECGKLITSESEAICPVCSQKRDREMAKIRDCVRVNPKISLLELSAQSGISTKRIIQFMHEGLITYQTPATNE